MPVFRLASVATAIRTILLVLVLCATCAIGSASAIGPCPGPLKCCPTAGTCPGGGCINARDLCLLEPTPGGVSVIPATATGNMGAFFTYINQGIWGWAFGVAIGIAVLNGTVAGFQIMLGNRDGGKERFMWSTIGLLILLLSGVILAFINPVGFQVA